ncbi:MAG: cache domain-containing protein [Candidatus Brocadiales bacterium]
MRKSSLSARSRLLIFGLCISLIPIAIITTIYYLNARSVVKQQTLDWLTAVAESRRAHVLSFVNEEADDILSATDDEVIRETLERVTLGEVIPGAESSALNKHLQHSYSPLDRHVAEICIVDLEGNVIGCASGTLTGEDFSGEEAFLQGLQEVPGRIHVSRARHIPSFNMNGVPFSSPIISKGSGEKIGVIIYTYRLDALSEITTNRAGMGETGEVYLVDKDWLMLTESRFTEGAPLKQVVDTEPIRRIAGGGGGMAGIYPDYRGVSIVGASAHIPEYGWTLLAEIDKAEAFAPLRTLGLVALIVGLLSAAAVTSAVIIFAYSRLMSTGTPAEAPGAPTGEAAGGIRPFRSIKARLLIFVLCISLIPVVLLTTIYYLNARHALKQQALEWLTAVAESRRLHIVSYLEEEKGYVIHFSQDRFTRENLAIIERGGPDKEKAIENLNRHLSSDAKTLAAQVLAIMVVDMDGEILASSDSKLLGQDISDMNVFTKARDLSSGEAYIGQPRYLSYLGENVIFFSVPVTSLTNGDTIGVMVDVNSLSSLNDITSSRAGMGDTGEVVLGRMEGDRIVFISPLRYVRDAPLSLSVPVGSVGAEPMRLALEGRSGALIGPDYRGVDVVAAYQDIPFMDWGLVAKVDKSEAFAPIRLQGIIALIVGVIAAAAVTCLGFVFALSTARPIRRLTDATRRFAGGDLRSRVKIAREDEIGELAGSFNMMVEGLDREITERKRVEASLHESEEKFRSISDTAQDSIIMIDGEGRVELWNNAAEKLFGYSKEEAVGKAMHPLIVPEKDRGDYLNGLQGFKATGRGPIIGKTLVLGGLKKDGTEFYADHSFSAIKMKGKWHAISIIRDITERKEMEEKLEERATALALANVRLKELDKLKSMFVASMSHELRTPLNSIIGFTGIILQGVVGELSEKQKDHLGRANRSAKHLLSLINDIIDISKVEAGKVETFVEEFTLDEVIGEAIESVQPQVNEKGLTLEVSIPPGIRLKTDRRRLLQCLLNFLSNAVKFTEAGTISVAAREINGEVEITVSDTGIGIAGEDLSRLFDAFVRLDSPLRAKTSGTGLGLYLTKKLATEVLGGTVAARSEPGRGSTFTLRVPKELKQGQA